MRRRYQTNSEEEEGQVLSRTDGGGKGAWTRQQLYEKQRSKPTSGHVRQWIHVGAQMRLSGIGGSGD